MKQNETNTTILKIFDALNSSGHNLSADSLIGIEMNESSFDLSSSEQKLASNFFKYSPSSFDDLKLFIGVPNDAIDHKVNGAQLKDVNLEHLSGRLKNFNSDQLSEEEKDAIEALSYNLLHGSTQDINLSQSPYSDIVHHLMTKYETIDVFVASDLNVPDGSVYKISTPTAVFNTVTIHGSGQIVLEVPNCKITANTIQYIEK